MSISGGSTSVGIIYQSGRWEVTIPGLPSPQAATSLDDALRVAHVEIARLDGIPKDVGFYVRISREDLDEYVRA